MRAAAYVLLLGACGDFEGSYILLPKHGLPNRAIVRELSPEEQSKLCVDSARRMRAVSASREARCTKEAVTWGGVNTDLCRALRKECMASAPADDGRPQPEERCAAPASAEDEDVPGVHCALTVGEYADCVAQLAERNRRLAQGCEATDETIAWGPFRCGHGAPTYCNLFHD